MFLRVQILKAALVISRAAVESLPIFDRQLDDWIIERISPINSQGVIFFSKGDNLVTLNRAVRCTSWKTNRPRG
jgi:hypothetical protein